MQLLFTWVTKMQFGGMVDSSLKTIAETDLVRQREQHRVDQTKYYAGRNEYRKEKRRREREERQKTHGVKDKRGRKRKCEEVGTDEERERKERQRVLRQKYYQKRNEYKRKKRAADKEKMVLDQIRPEEPESYPEDERLFRKLVFRNEVKFQEFVSRLGHLEKKYCLLLEGVYHIKEEFREKKLVRKRIPRDSKDLMASVIRELRSHLANAVFSEQMDTYRDLMKEYEGYRDQFRKELFGEKGDMRDYFGYQVGYMSYFHIRPEWVMQWCIERGYYRLVEMIWEWFVGGHQGKTPGDGDTSQFFRFDKDKFIAYARKVECCSKKGLLFRTRTRAKMIKLVVQPMEDDTI